MRKDRVNIFTLTRIVLFYLTLLLTAGNWMEVCAQEKTTSSDSLLVSSTDTVPAILPSIPVEAGILPEYPTSKNILGTSPTWQPNSTTALLCAIIPGGGQLYNRKYWKVPIVLGAATACIYAVTWNGRLYNEYHTAYVDFMNENPLEKDSWKAFIPVGADPKNYVGDSNIQSRLKKGSELYRRNRDLSIIVSAAVYILSFVDAYVDAELFNFEVSPNLSMTVAPSLASPTLGRGVFYPSLSCSLSF